MTSTNASPQAARSSALQERARRHLWMHFTRMGDYEHETLPVIVRGEGCYVYDEFGGRYLDGLSGLFCVNAGHGRAELVDAGARQARELAYYPTWSYAHEPAIALAERIAGLAPGDLNRVFFTCGGSEAVESAIKLARQYHRLAGKANKHKIVARETAYHGVTMGALSLTGITDLRTPFEPLTPGGAHVPTPNVYRMPAGWSAADYAEAVRQRILFEGPDTVAAVIVEPVQNAGGSLVPPAGYCERLREICDELDVLLIADEVITAWGRLGEWFASPRYGLAPDLITTAKALSSAYAPIGAVIASDRVAEPFMAGTTSFLHGLTFGGHPVACAIASANLDVFEREGLLEHVRAHQDTFRQTLERLYDIPIVGDVRGDGYFFAIELVKDRETKATLSEEECDRLLRGYLSTELLRRGLICRNDDRGDPVVQIAPPLVAGPEQFEEIVAILRPVLEQAAVEVGAR